jgi:serine/threonine protein kinase
MSNASSHFASTSFRPPPSAAATKRLSDSDEARAHDGLEAGTRIGDYVLGEVLGRGGFGVTYEATDARSGQRVAIKEFFPLGCVRARGQDEEWEIVAGALGERAFGQSRAQFAESARVLEGFRHAALARVVEHFAAHSTVYMAMELLRGRTLQKRVEKNGPLDSRDAVSVVEALGQAVSTMHRLDFLHLDIKPENVFVCENEDGDPTGRVVLFDFDLLQRFDRFDGGITRPLTAHCGTPGYAPLEQYAQQAALGPFTDIYALGATLFFLLTGHDPPGAADRALDGASSTALVTRVAEPTLASALQWALEMEPAQRPVSVEEWLPALKMGRPQTEPQDTDPDDGCRLSPPLPSAATPPSKTALPPLPLVDNWHQIAARENAFDWPHVCACCGRTPDIGLAIRAGKATWPIPYCRRCARHVRAAHAAVKVTTGGMAIGLVVAFVGWMMSDIWVAPSGMAIHFSAMFYGALKVQEAEGLMEDHCCDRQHSVSFGGERQTRAGLRYLVRFRSLEYAHKWKGKNAAKL